jgi:hypothetical protein
MQMSVLRDDCKLQVQTALQPRRVTSTGSTLSYIYELTENIVLMAWLIDAVLFCNVYGVNYN